MATYSSYLLVDSSLEILDNHLPQFFLFKTSDILRITMYAFTSVPPILQKTGDCDKWKASIRIFLGKTLRKTLESRSNKNSS